MPEKHYIEESEKDNIIEFYSLVHNLALKKEFIIRIKYVYIVLKSIKIGPLKRGKNSIFCKIQCIAELIT